MDFIIGLQSQKHPAARFFFVFVLLGHQVLVHFVHVIKQSLEVKSL